MTSFSNVKVIEIWFRVAFVPWWADLHPVCANGLSSISGIRWTRNLGEKVPTGTEKWMTSCSHVKVKGFGFECCLTHVGLIYIRFAPIDSVLLAAYVGLDIWVKKLRPDPNSG